MQKIKTFLKKTKRGNILKIVREHYLRDDLWCGSRLCKKCQQEKFILDANPCSESNIILSPHYVILDSNVILHQKDILESNVLKNVIILQTILDEVKRRSIADFQSLITLISNPDNKFYVFINEHHKDTYIERLKGESVNDRNDRAIRRACFWYKDHLNKFLESSIDILLLTNDIDNKHLAIKNNLLSMTGNSNSQNIYVVKFLIVEEYVNSLSHKYPELLDKLNRSERINSNLIIGMHNMYPEHLSLKTIHDGLKAGNFLQGIFHASRENYLEGFVTVEGKDQDVFIQGLLNLNRAVENDIVAVKLLAEEEWSCQSSIMLDDDVEDPDEGVFEKEVQIKLNVKKELCKPTGCIVGIIKRRWRSYCGMLQSSILENTTRHLFIPIERGIPKIRIETRQANILKNQHILVSIDSWPCFSRYPQGHYVRALGKIGEKDTENEVLLLEHDIPHNSFPESVLACLPKLPWTIPEEELLRREDLRHLTIYSVDPPGCTDIDDALHCTLLQNGTLEVGVHIADVTHFVRPSTILDKEASNRGTTVYLVDKRIDMLPGVLSGDLCSLRPNETRLAFSCIWRMSETAEILDTRFCKSVIRSSAALTYGEAQLRIDDPKLNDKITKSLRTLNRLAKILKQQRLERGALILASPEVRFEIDSETFDPIDVASKEMLEANYLVEEFMLLANISTAARILHEFPECAVLRRHPNPPLSNFEPLVKAAQVHGFDIVIDSGRALSTSLDKANLPSNPYWNTLLRLVATRCMLPASYFVSGCLPKEEYKHYGLACSLYTHFTSPIRRYADIMVHRLLAIAIGADSVTPHMLDKKSIQDICTNLNYRHRMAQYAGRASVGLHAKLFFKDRVHDEDGYILAVRKNALQIFIPKYGLEGSLFLDSPDARKTKFTFSEEELCQYCGNVRFRLFDRVRVQISTETSNLLRQKLVLRLVSPVV